LLFIGFSIVSRDVLVKMGDMRMFDYIPAQIEAKSDSSHVARKEVGLKQIS